MNFTKTPPTQPGFYWMRDSDGGPTAYICEMVDGELRCGPRATDRRFPVESFSFISTEWSYRQPMPAKPNLVDSPYSKELNFEEEYLVDRRVTERQPDGSIVMRDPVTRAAFTTSGVRLPDGWKWTDG